MLRCAKTRTTRQTKQPESNSGISYHIAQKIINVSELSWTGFSPFLPVCVKLFALGGDGIWCHWDRANDITVFNIATFLFDVLE